MKLTSTAFTNMSVIPSRWTCDGDGGNPPLSIADAPSAAASLALLVDDPDAPGGVFTHWIVWNIPVTASTIDENSVPLGANVGENDYGETSWGPPCPPSGSHRYFFRLFALDRMLAIATGATRKEFEQAIEERVLATAELIGAYSR